MNTFNAALNEARKALEAESTGESGGIEYEQTDTGMLYYTERGNPVYITNFTAEIKADITTDDGAEQTRSYALEAELFHRRKNFEVLAKEFASGNWVDEYLGARARVTTGQSMRSHMVNAIKYCSAPVEQYHYAHTGWRKIDGEMVFLHAGGALSQVSQVAEGEKDNLTHKNQNGESASQANGDTHTYTSESSESSESSKKKIHVKLTGTLSNYQFPEEKGDIKKAIRASLGFLNVTHDTITFPLLASAYRVVIAPVDYGIHVAGQTGLGKTELTALIQQHFGPAMDAHHLPGSWESTENSLEMLLFQAKDVAVVVDDFKPKGAKYDQDRLHMKADRVFRQVGNGSARGRLNSNLEQRAERRPRCLLISTGEDVPRGQSLKARAVVRTLHEPLTTGEASQRLLAAQKDARSGLYAQAMAAFIEWLAPQITDIQAQMPALIEAERERLHIDGHARAGTNTANMLLGMKYFLRFACECGALTQEESQSYLTRCINALKQIAREASSENAHDKPSEQWQRLIVAAITNKSAHLVRSNGDNPGLEYGWSQRERHVQSEEGSYIEMSYQGGGSQIGWIDGDDIYLLPTAAYKAARAIGEATGDSITTTELMLRKFLVQDGMLASTGLGTPRKTITVRRRLEGLQRDVLHIKRGVLFPDDTSSESVDSDDSLDSEPQESASQGTSENAESESSKGSESSESSDSDTTNDEMPFLVNKINVLLSRVRDEYIVNLFNNGLWAGTLDWDGDAGQSEFQRGNITWEAYQERVLACVESGNITRIKAAIQVMEWILSQQQQQKRGEVA
jgi:hypothetical protein